MSTSYAVRGQNLAELNGQSSNGYPNSYANFAAMWTRKILRRGFETRTKLPVRQYLETPPTTEEMRYFAEKFMRTRKRYQVTEWTYLIEGPYLPYHVSNKLGIQSDAQY